MPEETAQPVEVTPPTMPSPEPIAKGSSHKLLWVVIAALISLAVAGIYAYSQGFFSGFTPEAIEAAEAAAIDEEITNLNSEFDSLDEELSALEEEMSSF